MQRKPKISDDPAKLRHDAETRLRNRPTKPAPNRADADTQRLLHELEVHQIELEMQNAELQETRNEIEAALEKYTDLYDFAPVGYLTLDQQGAIIEANLTGARLLGIERSALVNRRFGLFVSPSDRPAFADFLKKVFENKAREGCEVTLLVEGEPPLDAGLEAIVFESGLACRVALTDITERKLAEAATARLTAIVKSSSDAIIGKDLNSIVTSWNAGAEKIFGYSASEMVGCPISRLIPSDRQQEVEQIMSRIKNGQSVEDFETLRVAKDGRLLDMSVSVSPIRHASGKIAGASTVGRNITERKRAERDRLVLNKLESTGILAGGIAHDFNNLLTVISLNLELAETLLPPGEELADRLREAKKTVAQARGLTHQLVTFAEGGAPIRKATSLFGVIQESSRLALSGSRARCEFFLAKDLWPAEVDEGQIGQVIRNMVLNAREAMPEGGVVSVRAENVVLRIQENPSLPPGEYVRLSIADRGGGISKQMLPKLFDPYFSTKQRGDQKGMGLGLTICHTVIQKHGGAIAVESEEGVGTSFHIYLPASRKLSGEEKASAPKNVPRHRRILVMDDEEGIRKVIGDTLRRMGHEVELAADGQMAVEVYEKAKCLGRPFHAVLLDLMVRGGMGGQQTVQTLLRIDPAVKAIVMSGYAADPVIVEHQRHGFSGALAKPFNLGQLREVISRVLGS